MHEDGRTCTRLCNKHVLYADPRTVHQISLTGNLGINVIIFLILEHAK